MASYADLPGKDSFTETINEIIELKSTRKYLFETNISRNQAKKEAVAELRDRVANFRELARNLQSAITIENNRTFSTEDEQYITGQIKPNAPLGDYEIEVLELAEKQLLVSELISTEISLPVSLIEIKHGEENITFEFAGGSPQSLARSLTENSKGAFTANLVRRTPEESYFVIKANQAGFKNRFNLQIDTGGVFNKLKLFKQVPPVINTLVKVNEFPTTGQVKSTTANEVVISGSGASLNENDGNETVLVINKTVDYNKSQNVFFKVSPIIGVVGVTSGASISNNLTSNNVKDESIEQASATNMVNKEPDTFAINNTTNTADTNVKDISNTLASANNFNNTNEFGNQDKTDETTSVDLLKKLANSNEPLLELTYKIEENERQKTFTWKNVSKGRLWINDINLQAKFDKNVQLVSAKFLPNSEGIDYRISDWWEQLYNTNQERFTPINEQQKPTQTKFKFYSIEMEQDGNEVTDLIEGVTLNFLKAKEGPIRFSILGNDSTYTGQIINFVNEYNFTMDLINIYLAPDKEDLSANNLDPKDEEKIGVLSSEVNIRRIKEKMQGIMQDSYVIEPTERKIYLQEIGLKIFNSFAKPFHINNSKIEIEENILNAKVAQYGDKIKNLFRYDQNRDYVPDGGFAYLMDRLLTEYLGPNSFFNLMEKSLEREQKILDNSLTSENEKISKYREKLEYDFAKVKQIQEQQKQMNNWLNSIQPNN